MKITLGNGSAILLAVVALGTQFGELYNAIVNAYGQCAAAVAPVIPLLGAFILALSSSPIFSKKETSNDKK